MIERLSRPPEVKRLGAEERSDREKIVAHELRIARLRELLEEMRAVDFRAFVELRAQMSVFDLIEADGEKMSDALCVRGNFKREEISLSLIH